MDTWTAATYKACFLSYLHQQTAKENSRCLILETISCGIGKILHPCCTGSIKLSLVQISGFCCSCICKYYILTFHKLGSQHFEMRISFTHTSSCSLWFPAAVPVFFNYSYICAPRTLITIIKVKRVCIPPSRCP